MFKKIGISLLVFVSLVTAGSFVYLSFNYEADDVAVQIYEDNKEKLVFEGEKTDIGFIIYPGGKVDELAYLRMAKLLNEEGYTVAVAKFPFDIGFFGINKADDIIENCKTIDNWVIIGHSLGGVTASEYAYKNDERIMGLVFLASYPMKDLTSLDIENLYIRGSNDKVLNLESYKEGREANSENSKEIVIDGGNHAGFANYGIQKGDGENSIGYEEQQSITVDAILEFIK